MDLSIRRKIKLIYPAISLDHSNPVTNKNLIGNYLIKTFNQIGVETHIAFYKNNLVKYFFAPKKLFHKFFGQNYIVSREPKLIKFLAKKISPEINASDADFVFAFGTHPIAFLDTDKPIFIITDSTFNNLLNRYDEYFNLTPKFIEENHKIEEIAFEKARKIFFSSKFAIDDAVNFYGVDPKKLVQVPLGANIDKFPSEAEMLDIVQNKLNKPLELLMIGKNWHRKGMDIGIQIFEKISTQLNNCKLTIVGTKPPTKIDNPNIEIIEKIDKSTKEGAECLEQLFQKSHFLLFPSRAEAFGHVVSEANAYGIPVFGSNVGGIPSAIENGTNGHLFDLSNREGIEFVVDKIIQLYSAKEKYQELAFNSYKTFSSKLNWKTIVENIKTIIEHTIYD